MEPTQSNNFMKPYYLAMAIAMCFSFYAAIAQQDPKAKADELYVLATNLDGTKFDSLRLLSGQIADLSNTADYDLGGIRALLVGALYGINKFKLDSALSLLNDADELVVNAGYESLTEAGISNIYRAQIIYRKMEFDAAEEYLDKALTIFRTNNETRLMSRVYNVKGTIEKLKQNEFKGLSHYLTAYKLKLESGVGEKKLREDLMQIGRSYMLLGQHERAIEYFRRVQHIYRATPDHMVLSAVYHDLGTAKTQLSENDSALYFFKRAKEIATKNQDIAMAAIIDAATANLYTSINMYGESNNLVVPLITKAGHLRFSPMAASTRLTAATNYLRLKKYDSAMIIAKAGYRMTKADKKKRASFSKIISEIFEKRGNSDSSLHYLKAYTAVNDSAFSIDNQRKLSTLYAEIETLAKQKEIELLEKQTALDKSQKRFLWGGIFLGTLTFAFIIVALRLEYRNRKKSDALEKLELQRELDLKKKDLHEQALKMIYLNNGITEIEANLKKLQNEPNPNNVRQLLSSIHVNKSLEKEWDNFNEYFSSVHTGFYDKIDSGDINLTISERRLAGLIRMNMTTSEIAGILNIEHNSVKMAKHRLKKKIGLGESDDIHAYLQKL